MHIGPSERVAGGLGGRENDATRTERAPHGTQSPAASPPWQPKALGMVHQIAVQCGSIADRRFRESLSAALTYCSPREAVAARLAVLGNRRRVASVGSVLGSCREERISGSKFRVTRFKEFARFPGQCRPHSDARARPWAEAAVSARVTDRHRHRTYRSSDGYTAGGLGAATPGPQLERGNHHQSGP